MFSQTAEYALRAVHFLARHPEATRTIQQIAADTKIPPDYLSKVMQGLARSGVVSSQRGKRGGFKMARAVDELSLFDITEAVAPSPVLERCPRGLPEHKDKLCALHECCRQAMLAYHHTLKSTRLSDVIDSPFLEAAFPAPPALDEA